MNMLWHKMGMGYKWGHALDVISNRTDMVVVNVNGKTYRVPKYYE